MTTREANPTAHAAAAAAPAVAERGRGFTLRTFESLQDANFRLFYLSMLGHMAAMNMQMLVRGWLAFHLTGSFAALGFVGVAQAIPTLFLSIYGGVLADRLPKRRTLQIGQAVSGVNAVTVALLLVAGWMRFEYLLVAAFVQGTTQALMMPSRQAMIPEVVGKERLMNAVSLGAAGMNLMRLMAPALGGFLIDVIGADAVYFLMGGMYAFAVAMLFSVRIAYPAPPRATSQGGISDIADGVRYIREHRTLLWILAATFITSLLAMPYLLLMPGFVSEVFGGEGFELGLLISISGAGALVGALTLASLPSKRRGVMLLGSAFVIGASLLGFSASPSIWIAAVFMVFVGVGSAGRQALGNVLLQSYAEDAYRGRVMSVFMTQFSVMSLGAFVVGVAAEWIGVRWALGIMAGTLVVVSSAFLLLVPRLRRLD